MGGVDSRDGAAIVVVILFVCCFFTSVRTGSEVGFLGRLSDFGAEWVTWDDNLSLGCMSVSDILYEGFHFMIGCYYRVHY